MKTIILAGGYGVRLQEDIQKLETTDQGTYQRFKHLVNVPKPLLPINGKPLIEYILQELERANIHDALLCTNRSNHEQFLTWKKNYQGTLSLELIDHDSPFNTYGPGVMAAVAFIIETCHIHEDLLLIAGDTIFDYSLSEVLQAYTKLSHSIIVAHQERPEFIRLRGVVEFDDHHKIISYEEKPTCPKSIYAATPTFLFDRACTSLLPRYVQETHNDNNLGNVVPWLLAQRRNIFVFLTDREIFDVGNVESISLAEEFFTQKL